MGELSRNWVGFEYSNRTGIRPDSNPIRIGIESESSLVPAAAVIPAPIAYIKVVAVKKLVVEVLTVQALSLEARVLTVIRLQI